jgi:hydrogenase expression/formation protein HypD
MAAYMLVKQITNNEAKVQNEYTRTVRYDGNQKALELLNQVFEPTDMVWRGFSTIPSSGMKLREEHSNYDARIIYADILDEVHKLKFEESDQCRCGEILRGLVEPRDCILFAKTCTPQHPVGPCMVSVEGSCNIEFRYRRS